MNFMYFLAILIGPLVKILYSFIGNYAVTMVVATLLLKLLLFPLSIHQQKSSAKMAVFQPLMNEIQQKYKNDPQKQQEELMKLQQEHGYNPMGGCLWSFLPFPILIALYAIIRQPLRYLMGLSVETISSISDAAVKLGYTVAEGGNASAYEQIYLAKFVHQNWASFDGRFDGLINLDYNFLGMDLASQGSTLFGQITTGGWAVIGVLLLPIIATALQFLMTMISMKTSGNTSGQGKLMMYLMPLMTLWMGYILPAALCVYWIANTAFAIVQEQVLNKYFNKVLDREETDKERAKREARAAKMMASRERMLQQQQQMEKAKSGGKKPQNASAKKQDKRASTNENGRVGQRPYARGRAYSEHHYDE